MFRRRSLQLDEIEASETTSNYDGVVGKKLQSNRSQPSYWKFLAEKLPPEGNMGPSGSDSCIVEEPECGQVAAKDIVAQRLQSIDTVLHIVTDNHKSHEASRRSHSIPGSNHCLRSSVSAPGFVQPKNRWGPAPPSESVKHSPKVPSRRNPMVMDSSVSQSNALWSDRPSSSSSQDFSHLDSCRLSSLGLSELKSRFSSSVCSSDQKSPRLSKRKSKSLGSASSQHGPPTTSSTECRWSIPSNNSDSLLIYPQRCQD